MNNKALKRKLLPADYLLLLVNLIPVWGVWFQEWNAREVFMVYCLETIVIGLYTLLKLAIAGTARPVDEWSNNSGQKNNQPFWLFMIFFLFHYGLFVSIQLSIFLEASGAQKAFGISNAWDFIVHFKRYLSENSQWFLMGLIISYGFIVLKDFVINGAYKTTSLGVVMFEPYGRIIVQQFTVIVGSLFLGLGAGKIFISIFVAMKIFVDVFVDYRGLLAHAQNKESAKSVSEQ